MISDHFLKIALTKFFKIKTVYITKGPNIGHVHMQMGLFKIRVKKVFKKYISKKESKRRRLSLFVLFWFKILFL